MDDPSARSKSVLGENLSTIIQFSLVSKGHPRGYSQKQSLKPWWDLSNETRSKIGLVVKKSLPFFGKKPWGA